MLEKQNHLEKTKKIYRKVPLFSIIVASLTMISLFTFTIWQGFVYYVDLHKVVPLMIKTTDRNVNFQNLRTLTLDSILNSQFRSYKNESLFYKYQAEIKQLDSEIVGSLNSALPSEFENGIKTIKDLYLNNLCQKYREIKGEDIVIGGILI
jgi:hypothetical protein